MLIGGKASESITPANSNCEVLINDSVAIASVKPTEGNPSMRIPPSIEIGENSVILSSGFKPNLISNSANNSFM